MLAGSVAFVLLIACANVANLQLARAMGRRKELSVRAALGAGRGRLAADVFAESVRCSRRVAAYSPLRSRMAALPSFARWVAKRSAPQRNRAESRSAGVHAVDLSVVRRGFWRRSRLARRPRRRQRWIEGRWTRVRRRQLRVGGGNNTRRTLVAAEVALAVVLLAGASLLIRSFAQLQRVWPGFNPAQVLTFELTANGRRYNDAAAGDRDVPAARGTPWQITGSLRFRRRLGVAIESNVCVGAGYHRRPSPGAGRSVPQRRHANGGRPVFRGAADSVGGWPVVRRSRHPKRGSPW
mgnify:CR=1 FL=1